MSIAFFFVFVGAFFSLSLVLLKRLSPPVKRLLFRGFCGYAHVPLILCVCFFLLETGSVSFYPPLGLNILALFIFSFSLWFISFLIMWCVLLTHSTGQVLPSLVLVWFDLCILTLRPFTLTLRIRINVSLGHSLIEMIYCGRSILLFVVGVVERFVYLVQSFVFSVLVRSYLFLN